MKIETVFKFLNNYKAFIAIIIISIICLPILIYIWYFHTLPLGSPSDFAEFATYYSGFITPIFTFLSVLALVLTLMFQQHQFKKQQNSALFESYIQRFEIHYERYVNLINVEFPCYSETQPEVRFKLVEFRGLISTSEKYFSAVQNFELIEKIRNMPLDEVSKLEIRRIVRFYIDDLKLEADSAKHSLLAAYTFAEHGNVIVLGDLWQRLLNIIIDLRTWRIISKDEYIRLKNEIDIPERLLCPE